VKQLNMLKGVQFDVVSSLKQLLCMAAIQP